LRDFFVSYLVIGNDNLKEMLCHIRFWRRILY